ncbi:MAG TPA: helix-turn-helix transcriptional regulator [Puia sp.]|uniref:helix-turn-helix domain-containing protein n=1 Tax=Puia sp. TaxID=2045100 RepID=UPI002B62EB1D|nr:helix-turn-helix transcriptional regulator [Puia sp.]HVU96957.1 helix-turn-helix transcriptional regulator [Puia sp.]
MPKIPYRIKSITEYHRLTGLPKPEHPLISVIDVSLLKPALSDVPVSLVFDFYCISLKKGLNATIRYGQEYGDFDEGVLFFMAPGQVWGFTLEKGAANTSTGWMILVHPDFLWGTQLAKNIKKHGYFNYSVKEALYLSEKEEQLVKGIILYIEQEYHANIDKFSQPVIVAQLEVLFTYADRFYQRQFITRKVSTHQLLERLEETLDSYFSGNLSATNGLPSVVDIADQLNVSAGYLSDLLKILTGQTTQQHIHDKLIEKAKEKLSTTNMTVSEIAYDLGFEHMQSFSKLFKSKTKMSPVEFRATFN